MEVEKRLKQQTIWLSGAGSGIGRSAALALAAEGAKLVLFGRKEVPLQETAALVQKMGGETKTISLDVSRRDAVIAITKDVLAEWPQVDVLVNNAGINVPQRRLHELDPKDWDAIIGINLTGAYNLVYAVLPSMRQQKKGMILNVSSMAGKRAGGVSGASYVASKHGLNGLNHAINAEEGKNGIRACVICPGEVNTEIIDKRPVKLSQEVRMRMMQAQDIAQAICFVVCMHPRTVVTEMLLMPTHQRQHHPDELG